MSKHASGEDLADADVSTIEAHIEQTRADLGRTVDELGAKLDVKQQVRERTSAARDKTREHVEGMRRQLHSGYWHARDAVTDGEGAIKPQVRTGVGTGAGLAVVALVVAAVVVWRRR